MKNIILSFSFLITFTSYSQDPRLFEQTWILHNLIINGQSNVPPNNAEVSFIPADFLTAPDEFTTSVCSGTTGSGPIIYNGLTEFTLPMGMGFLAGSCNLQINIDYTNLYYYVFWEGAFTDPLQYEIIDNGADRSLIITSLNGNQALYGNNLLAINEFENFQLVIYPNPTHDILNIKYEDEIIVETITVNDITGKNILIHKNKVSNINLENFTAGIYFITFENHLGHQWVKKIIKR